MAAGSIADYELLEVIDTTPTGVSYTARPPERLGVDDELVVVKVLATSLGGTAYRRVQREVRAVASVPSEHLVLIYDVGQDDDRCYVVSEHHPLGSLARPAEAPLAPALAVGAVAGAARAAHDLHEHGFAHRDIRPEHVFLHPGGGRLGGLALVQTLEPGQTATSMASSLSVECLDPDLVQGGKPSRATDVWALGVTLHLALTGRGVWGELPPTDPVFAIRRMLTGSPELDPGLEPALAEVVSACVARDPAERPATALALAERLDALVPVV